MKMKKLLSMGALALVLASSVSVGASAATVDSGISPETKALMKIAAKAQYQNGKNQTDLFAGINKESKLKDVSNDKVITAINAVYTTTDSAVRIAEAQFDKNKELTFAQALDKVTRDQNTFDTFKQNVLTVAEKVEAMDALDGKDRSDSEKQFILFVSLYNNNLKATFGKDAEGRTSVILKEKDELLVQLNFEQAQKAINELEDFTYDKAKANKDYLNK